MSKESSSAFLRTTLSFMLKTLRGALLIFLVSFYTFSTSQASSLNPLVSSKKITVTHSHGHSHEHDHGDEHENHHEEDQGSEPTQHKTDSETGAHTHTVIVVNSPIAYTSPIHSGLIFIDLLSPEFSTPENISPPLDPSLASIFRPPIA